MIAGARVFLMARDTPPAEAFVASKQVIQMVIVGVPRMSVSTGRCHQAKKATLGMTLSLRACRIAGNTLGCASASDRFFRGLAAAAF